MSVRAFSSAIGVPVSTTRNYLDKNTKPSSGYIELIVTHFKTVNLNWFITGQGDPFLPDSPSPHSYESKTVDDTAKNFSTGHITGKNTGVVGNNTGSGHQHGASQTVDKLSQELAAAQKEIEHLQAQLASANALIASKDDFITLLRASYQRPN